MNVSNNNPNNQGSQAIATQDVGVGIDSSRYSTVQKNDEDKIQADADSLAAAEKSGDKSKINSARADIKDDFKQAEKDGISKSDLKKLSLNVHDGAETARIAGDLVNGKVKPDDPHLKASIQNQYVRDCKANGVGPKNAKGAQAYFANYANKLVASGVPTDRAQKAAQAAQDCSTNKLALPSNTRV